MHEREQYPGAIPNHYRHPTVPLMAVAAWQLLGAKEKKGGILQFPVKRQSHCVQLHGALVSQHGGRHGGVLEVRDSLPWPHLLGLLLVLVPGGLGRKQMTAPAFLSLVGG